MYKPLRHRPTTAKSQTSFKNSKSLTQIKPTCSPFPSRTIHHRSFAVFSRPKVSTPTSSPPSTPEAEWNVSPHPDESLLTIKQIYKEPGKRLTIHPTLKTILPTHSEARKIPRLTPALRSVLKQQGPVTMGQLDQDTPFISPDAFQPLISPTEDINWATIPEFTPSSRDPKLFRLTQHHGALFSGSTSSVSSLLTQITLSLSGTHKIAGDDFSSWFQDAPLTITRASRKPSVNILRKRSPAIASTYAKQPTGPVEPAEPVETTTNTDKQVVWSIDAVPTSSPKDNQVMMDLGHTLERHLTHDWDDFSRKFMLQKDTRGQILPTQLSLNDVPGPEGHAFLKSGKLLLRSQLDCIDPDAPAHSKVFDLKTRSVLPIRFNPRSYEQLRDYKVNSIKGLYNSFEREYFDMARSAFPKWSNQCRIGSMGGVFVAYHNTEEMFGFEYIPLEKMDKVLHGSTLKASFLFRHSVAMLESIISRITADLGNPEGRPFHNSIRLMSRFHKGGQHFTVWAEQLPDIDLTCPEAIDAALSCPYRGFIYIDWLNEEQLKEALSRRGLDAAGDRTAMVRRLESFLGPEESTHVPQADWIYNELLAKNYVSKYEFGLCLYNTVSNKAVKLADVDDASLEHIVLKVYPKSPVVVQPHEAPAFRDLLRSIALSPDELPSFIDVPEEIKEDAKVEWENLHNERATELSKLIQSSPPSTLQRLEELLKESPHQLPHSLYEKLPQHLFLLPKTPKARDEQLLEQYGSQVIGTVAVNGHIKPLTRIDIAKRRESDWGSKSLADQTRLYQKFIKSGLPLSTSEKTFARLKSLAFSSILARTGMFRRKWESMLRNGKVSNDVLDIDYDQPYVFTFGKTPARLQKSQTYDSVSVLPRSGYNNNHYSGKSNPRTTSSNQKSPISVQNDATEEKLDQSGANIV
jgi:hypothetical protein